MTKDIHTNDDGGSVCSVTTGNDLYDTVIAQTLAKGLDHVTLKDIAKAHGTTVKALQEEYQNLDELLYKTFEAIHKEVAAVFKGTTYTGSVQAMALYSWAQTMWNKYFDYFIGAKEKTLYYFAYRDSSYIHNVNNRDRQTQYGYFKTLVMSLIRTDALISYSKKVNSEILWFYIIDTTGTFAKRIIRGELQDSAETRQDIWRLLFHGISYLFL